MVGGGGGLRDRAKDRNSVPWWLAVADDGGWRCGPWPRPSLPPCPPPRRPRAPWPAHPARPRRDRCGCASSRRGHTYPVRVRGGAVAPRCHGVGTAQRSRRQHRRPPAGRAGGGGDAACTRGRRARWVGLLVAESWRLRAACGRGGGGGGADQALLGGHSRRPRDVGGAGPAGGGKTAHRAPAPLRLRWSVLAGRATALAAAAVVVESVAPPGPRSCVSPSTSATPTASACPALPVPREFAGKEMRLVAAMSNSAE